MIVACRVCSKAHDISTMEPGFGRPDAVLTMPPWMYRATPGLCVAYNKRKSARFFVRALVPVTVTDLGVRRWGIWTELAGADFDTITDMWKEPELGVSVPATLANDIAMYEPLVGVRGSISLGLCMPYFAFDETIHPFAVEVAGPVSIERYLEWLLRIMHA